MDNEQEIIRQQMEDTRTALKEKLETLEQQVVDTVHGATEAVSDTVETVKETVVTVKATVEETVENVKETFNLSRHVQEHPWPALACATLVGFMGGRLLNRTKPQGMQGTAPVVPPAAAPLYRNGEMSAAAKLPSPPRQDWWSWLAGHYSDELAKVKGLAIATAGAAVRDLLTAEMTPEVGERIKEVIDGFTTKLGGEPIKGPILKTSPKEKAPAQASAPRWERPVHVLQE
jgi:ElaB/YqjD/DUF883 family membrane-anchored ribosome-binding protein